MMPAEDLYKRIKAKYSDFRVPKQNCLESFQYPSQTPLTEHQLELLEMRYPVKPNYDPFNSQASREHTSHLVNQLLIKMAVRLGN